MGTGMTAATAAGRGWTTKGGSGAVRLPNVLLTAKKIPTARIGP